MEILKRISNCGIIPVAVIDDVDNAVDTAKALLAGGLDVMEITFRTAAAADSIRAVARECPDMLVGAGTVVTLEQCKLAVDCGAKFIVSPGLNEELVAWCVENGVAVTPGCVTPSEIMTAMRYGLSVLKFFPANIYGGLDALKALAGPFGSITFIPTGGVNTSNLGAYMSSTVVHAVGGSWLCAKKDIAERNFAKITQLSAEARRIALGFEFAHIGINCDDAKTADSLCGSLGAAFDFATKEGSSSNFSSQGIEVMKSNYLGKNGHFAVRTNRIAMAIAEMERRGFAVDASTEKYKDGKLIAVYLKDELGGFAVHLLQK